MTPTRAPLGRPRRPSSPAPRVVRDAASPCMLGEAGATVYCTGRTHRAASPATGVYAGRAGDHRRDRGDGDGARRPRHRGPRRSSRARPRSRRSFARVRAEHGRLDVLVNDISEGELHDWKPFWQVSLDKGFRALDTGVHSHIITSHFAAPLMIAQRRGLIVEVGDGDTLGYRRRCSTTSSRSTSAASPTRWPRSRRPHGVAALAISPGFMRSEMMLEHFGVTESELARRRRGRIRTSLRPRRRSSSAARSPRSPPTRTSLEEIGRALQLVGPREESTVSRTSTAHRPDMGAQSRLRGDVCGHAQDVVPAGRIAPPRCARTATRRIRYQVAHEPGRLHRRTERRGATGSSWTTEIDFGALFAQFDTFLLGRRTFRGDRRRMRRAAARGRRRSSFRRRCRPISDVTIVADRVEETVAALRAEGQGHLAVRRRSLFRSLLEAGVVDTVEVAVMPVLLGGGIPLLPSPAGSATLTLTGHKVYQKTGIVMLEYAVVRSVRLQADR